MFTSNKANAEPSQGLLLCPWPLLSCTGTSITANFLLLYLQKVSRINSIYPIAAANHNYAQEGTVVCLWKTVDAFPSLEKHMLKIWEVRWPCRVAYDLSAFKLPMQWKLHFQGPVPDTMAEVQAEDNLQPRTLKCHMTTIREHGRADFQIRVKGHSENKKRDYYSDYLTNRTARRDVIQPCAT